MAFHAVLSVSDSDFDSSYAAFVPLQHSALQFFYSIILTSTILLSSKLFPILTPRHPTSLCWSQSRAWSQSGSASMFVCSSQLFSQAVIALCKGCTWRIQVCSKFASYFWDQQATYCYQGLAKYGYVNLSVYTPNIQTNRNSWCTWLLLKTKRSDSYAVTTDQLKIKANHNT